MGDRKHDLLWQPCIITDVSTYFFVVLATTIPPHVQVSTTVITGLSADVAKGGL